MTTKRTHSGLKFSRREAAAGLLALGGALLWACGSDSEGSDDEPSDTNDSDGGSTADAASDAGSDASAASEWASGGTKSMSNDYDDPFPLATAGCVLATAVTEGPCTEAADQVRMDVSEGYTGLPMRLALQVVDSSCKPINGAKVKIWHTQITGSYSGNTPNTNMCLKDQSDTSKHYFRGVQTTDAEGRVDFNSCFPGWYRGRCVHIHFTVTSGGRSFTSQLVFEQSLVTEIFSTHPEYKSFGQPDTPNATDNVVGNANLSTFVIAASRLHDGALLAAKQLIVNV